MHENAAETVTGGGSERRRWLQAASLFGLEQYGKNGETRSIGYAWGRLERIGDDKGRLTRWPRVAVLNEGGSLRIRDGDVDPYPHIEDVLLNVPRVQQVCRVAVIAVPAEFPFAESSLLRKIEELRPGLICEFVNADDGAAPIESPELGVVLVGGLQGKGSTLATAIAAKGTLVARSQLLDAKHVARTDWDPKALRTLTDKRGDAVEFATEDEVLGHVRPALNKVCRQGPLLVQDQVEDPFVSYVLRDLEEKRKEAHAAFVAGDFEKALSDYEFLAARTHDLREKDAASDEVANAWARSTLNLAACHLALRNTERAREILISVDPALLKADARLVLAKALVNVREMESAERVANTISAEATGEVQQLVQISRGQVPATKPQAGEQLIYAAQLLVREDRFHTALDWALSAVQLLENEVLGKLAALEVLMHLLEDWSWAEDWSDALSPGEAQTLLDTIETLLGELRARELAPPHARRVSEIEYGFAVRTDDPTRLERLKEALAELGQKLPLIDTTFDEALRIARAGDRAAALEAIDKDEHPWRARVRQIGLLTMTGDAAAALEASLRLVADFPNRLTTEYEAARHLMRAGRADDALVHARLAFAAVPGYGQRLLLADALLETEQHVAAAEVAEPLATRGDALALSIKAQSLEHIDVKRALEAWRAFQTVEDSAPVQIRIAGLELKAGRSNIAADEGWAVFRRSDTETLTPATLFQLALLQAVGAQTSARDRVAEIAQAIKRRATTPADEALYLQLWSWLRDPLHLPPPDVGRLIEAGALKAVTEPDLTSVIETQVQLESSVREGYTLGHVPLEAVVSELKWNVPRFVQSLGADTYLPASTLRVPDAGEREPVVGRLLVSEVELLLLEKLDLLDRVDAALIYPKEVLLFTDVWERFLQTVALMRLGAPEKRLDELQILTSAIMDPELVRIVATAPDGEPIVGETCQVAAVVAWLQEVGAISRTRAHALVPVIPDSTEWIPAGEIHVTGSALRWLVANDLLALVSAASKSPVVLRQSDYDQLRAERSDAIDEQKGLRACERVQSWVESRIHRGSARLIPRPQVDIPPAKHPTGEKLRGWISAALSWRVAASGNDAYCLSVDAFARDLYSGVYLPQILHALAWSQSSYLETKDRFKPLGERMVGMGWLASQTELELGITEKIASCGAIEVLDASGLVDLIDEYQLQSPVIQRILDIVEVPFAEPRHSKNIAAQLLIGRAYAAAIKLLLTEEGDGQDAGALALHLLNRLDRYGGRSVGGLLAFLLPAIFDQPAAAYVRNDDGRYTASTSSPTGRLLEAIVGWAGGDSKRLAQLGRAAADTVALIDKAAGVDGPNDVVLGVLQVFAELMPGRDGGDLTNDLIGALTTMSGVWKRSPLETLGVSVEIAKGSETHAADFSYEQLLVEGVALLGPKGPVRLTPLFASWEKSVQLGGVLPVKVPVETMVLRAAPEVGAKIARELASLQGPMDGVLYERLERFADAPTDVDARHSLARRAIQTPWKQVLRDPTAIFMWGRASGVHVGAPVRLEDVLQLLSEPAHFEQRAKSMKRLEQYVQGAWKERRDRSELFLLAANIPGAAGAQVASTLADEPQLDEALDALAFVSSVNANDIWSSLSALWIAAADDRSIKVGNEDRPARALLVEHVASLLRQAVNDPERGKLEAQVMRQCRRAVADLHPSPNNLVWLTYRLFGWLWVQIRSRDAAEVRSTLEAVAAWRGHSYAESLPRDPMDPAAWSTSPDLRLIATMNVVATRDGLPNAANERWWLPITQEIQDLLVRVASAEITDDDRQLRYFPDSELEWVGIAVPQENALFLLLREPNGFLLLEESVRLRWLQELPTDQTSKGLEDPLVGRLLIAVAPAIERISEIERTTLVDRLTQSSSPFLKEGPAQAVAIVSCLAFGLVSIEQVWPRIQNAVVHEKTGTLTARLYAEALVKTKADALSLRLTELLDAVRGPSQEDILQRVEVDPIFAGETTLIASIRDTIGATTSSS